MRWIIFFLITLSINAAADYYVSNSGDDGNSGSSTGSPWQTIAKVNSMSFSPGDTIHFQAGDVWREQLNVPSSGSSGNPITFTGYGSGANPKIYRTEIFNSWELPGGDYTANNIYRGSIPGQISYSGMLNAAGNSRSFFYYARPSDLSTWEDGRFQGFYGSNGYFYLRSDSGPPGPREVGCRQFGIYTQDSDYVVIDGFDVIGPGGRDANSINFWGDDYIIARERASIGIGPGSNHVTVKNCNVFYSNGVGVGKINHGDYAIIENTTTNGCWGGIFLKDGDHHRISGCRILNTGTIPEDAGDKDAIGAIGADKTDIIIEDTYIEKTCWQGASQCDTAITFWLSGGGTIRRCHIKDTGRGAIGFGELDGGAGMRIYDNIIEGWADISISGVSYNAIKVGGGATATYNDYGDIYIDNNLFINGNNPPAFTLCDEEGWGDLGRCRTTLLVNHYDFSNVYVRNNIFYNNPGVYELFYNPESSTNMHIENNIFYSTDTKDIISHFNGYAFFGQDGLQNPSDTPFNGFRGYISGNLFTDPMLVDPAGGNYQLSAGSPAIDAGIDVGLTQDHEGNPIVDTPDIGAYEYIQVFCPDGTCNNNENCSTCPDDCNVCSVECIHDADQEPCDGWVDFIELIDFMNLWKSGSVEINELMVVVGLWKASY